VDAVFLDVGGDLGDVDLLDDAGATAGRTDLVAATDPESAEDRRAEW
jgi:hypothetical protein